MELALGRLRDYLAQLSGEENAGKAGTGKTSGIGLETLAGMAERESVLSGKADKSGVGAAVASVATKEEVSALEGEMATRGITVGSIGYVAMARPPAGCFVADGSPVRRKTYPDLFETFGTVFGEWGGEKTFNLPDLSGRFVQGNGISGTIREAGLSNSAGGFSFFLCSGAMNGSRFCFSGGLVYGRFVCSAPAVCKFSWAVQPFSWTVLFGTGYFLSLFFNCL